MAILHAGDSLAVDPRKLVYLLTSGKARFFVAHGFSPLRPAELDAALRGHPERNPIETVARTVHGVKFTARCSLASPDGRNPCAMTVWIVDRGAIQARLVTAYASRPAVT